MIYDLSNNIGFYSTFYGSNGKNGPSSNRVNLGRLASLGSYIDEQYLNYNGPELIFHENSIVEKLYRYLDLTSRYPVHFLLSAKSTNQSKIFEHAKQSLSGFDVSNLNEYQMLPNDLYGKKVFITSPIAPRELKSFKTKGNSLFVIIDGYEYSRILEQLEPEDKFGIRFNTSDLLERYGYKGRSQYLGSRFGFSYDDLDFLSSLTERLKDHFAGIHFHHGSEANCAELYLALAEQSLPIIKRLNLRYGFVDFGGGFHEISEDLLSDLISHILSIIPNGIEIIFEPGRSITEDSGFAVTKISHIRKKSKHIECIVDISNECHLKWSKPNLILPYSEVLSDLIKVRVYGPTCYEGDLIGEYQVPQGSSTRDQIVSGDLLLFSGINGYSESWNSGFNGISPCGIRLI